MNPQRVNAGDQYDLAAVDCAQRMPEAQQRLCDARGPRHRIDSITREKYTYEQRRYERGRRADQLTEDPRFSPRKADLKELVVDIVDPDGDAWADVNLFAAFPTESTVKAVYRRPAENVVGAVAGAMVFAPVAWTWWGFHDASKAYEELITESGDPEGSTFLSLWAQGFDGRMDGFWGGLHQLVPMAMGSLLLVAAAVVAVILHRAIATRNVRREEEAAEEARILLTSALTKAQRVVSSRRADHPLRIEGIIKSSMEQLRAAHTDTASATRDLAVTAADVKTSIASLLDTVKSAGEEAASILARANEVNQTVSTSIAKVESSMASMETVSPKAYGASRVR